jgi:hypothetical protein
MTRRPALSTVHAHALLAGFSRRPAAHMVDADSAMGRKPAATGDHHRPPPETSALRHGPFAHHPTVEAKDMR